MAKDVIGTVINNVGSYNVATSEDITILYHNLSPIKTGTKEFSLSVRPALGTALTTMSIDDNSRGRGIADFQGYDLILVNDDTIYYSGGSLEIHSTQPFDKELMAKFVYFNQGGSDRLVLVNAGATSTAGTSDGSIWFMTSPTSAPTQVVSANAPGNNGNSLIRGGVSLDGYFFAADILGQIHNCNLDDIITWDALDFVTAESEADVGVYCFRHRDHVGYLGTRSIELFYNAGNAPDSPLQRRNDIYYSTGCYHPNSVLELGDVLYFIGKDSSGNAGLFMLNNFELTRLPISDVMSNIIKNLDFSEPDITAATNFQQDVYLASFNSESKGQYLVLTVPAGSFALHLETGVWSKWYIGGTPLNNGGITDWEDPKVFPLTASLNRPGANSTEPNRYVLLNGLVSSEQLTPGVEFGGILTGVVNPDFIGYSRPWDKDTNERKRINNVRLLHYPDGSSGSSPSNLEIDWIDTTEATATGIVPAAFTGGKIIDISGYIGRIYRGGITRQRIYKLVLDGTKLQKIKGLELDYDLLRG